jgi:selenide,water dikinase
MDPSLPEVMKRILADPQTSGGLLAAVPEKETGAVLELFREHGSALAAVIGHVEEGDGEIVVR